MAYLDNDVSKEGMGQQDADDRKSDKTTVGSQSTSNQDLYKIIKNKQPKKDYSDLIKMVVTGILVIFYIRPIARLSSDLAIYELVALLLFGITGAFMSRHKNNSLNGFLLGVLLCPLGLIMAAYLKDRTRVPCQFCQEEVKLTATVCPHCHKEI